MTTRQKRHTAFASVLISSILILIGATFFARAADYEDPASTTGEDNPCVPEWICDGWATPPPPLALAVEPQSAVCVSNEVIVMATLTPSPLSGIERQRDTNLCGPEFRAGPTIVIVPQVIWTAAGSANPEPASGTGLVAVFTNHAPGEVTVTFSASAVRTECPQHEDSAEESITIDVVAVSLDIPEIISVNDLVPNCVDPAGYPKKWFNDAGELSSEDDLFEFIWSVTPYGYGNVTLLGDSRVTVLRIDSDTGTVVVSPVFDPAETVELRLEGRLHSNVPGDAEVSLLYGPCVLTATTTVVQVQLDKFNYNRANPYPEVEILQISDLEPGETADVTYTVVNDVLDTYEEYTDTISVGTELGTYEYKTPEYENRLGNAGWAAIRYTIYDNDGTPSVRWNHAGPSHKRLQAMPAGSTMQIDIKDALADTPAEALGHLVPLPTFAGPVHIEGSRPAYVIPDIKIFARQPAPAYTNEVSPAIGNETILQTLHGIARDSAVVLEISSPRTVGVNDRFEAPGDPGDDASVDLDSNDPDFIKLNIEGVPGCIVKGTVTWSVLAGNIRLVSSDASQIGAAVTTDFTAGFPSDFLYVKVEGRAASDTIDDCRVRVEIVLDDGDASGNPLAFQGQTLSAEYKLTVTDLRWTGWKADDDSGKTPERTDMLACDLDLRPAVRIDYPTVESTVSTNNIVTVSGVARSMIDIVRDIRVNGQQVPQTNIFFLGQTVFGMTQESVRELTDRPPPYEVTFEYDLAINSGKDQTIRVEARGGIGPWPGTAERRLTLEAATPPATGSVVEAIEDLPSDPAYDLPEMPAFFDQGWAFLYKTEVDHRGAGKGLVECYEKAGAQPGGGLYRLRKPVVFLDLTAYGGNDAIPGPGLFLDDGQKIAPIQYYNGETTGMRKLFPIELTVSDSGGVVSNAIEWTHGALLVTNSSAGSLTISLPDVDSDLPDDAKVRLSVKAVDGQPNPYAGFVEIEFYRTELPATVPLSPASIVGVAAFEVELYSESEPYVQAKDRVKVTVIAPPELIAVTDFFTPRQIETPPYHGAKVDYKRWDVPTGAPCTIVFTAEDDGGATVFARPIDPDEAAVAYVPNFRMDELYRLDGTNDPYGFSFTVERLGWDGRYDADTNGVIDVEGEHTRWANQPATTVAPDVPYSVQFEIRNISGAVIYRTAVPLITKTTPLQLDTDAKPLMGPAPYFASFRDQINSKYSNVSIAGPQIVPQSGGFHVPRFNTYFNGNNWRHTSLRYGWGHNYDIRVTPVYVGGNRDLYVLWEGDHLVGPADADGYMWLNGIRVKLEETETDAEWTLTTPDGTVYTFGPSGQLESITDRNDNEVTITLTDAWEQDLIRRVDSVTGSDLTLSLGYTGPCENILERATLGGRTLTFAYHSEDPDVYAAPYPVDERLKSIDGDEYTQTFGYADGRRENPPSRVIGGEITNRVVGDITFNYGYPAPENIEHVVSSSIVNAFQIGTGADAWQVTAITGTEATYSGITETHAYAANKLQSISIEGGDSEDEEGRTANYAFQHDEQGRRKAQSSPAGVIHYDHDDNGNLTLTTYPDSTYGTLTLSYDAARHNQLTNRVTSSPASELIYELDTRGNVTNLTEKGGFASHPGIPALPDRTWTILRRANGTIETMTDTKGTVATHDYNNLGLQTSHQRAGVTESWDYDPLGRLTLHTPPAHTVGYGYSYDKWNRGTGRTYPDGGTESTTYTPLDFPRLHNAPRVGEIDGTTTEHAFTDAGKPTGYSQQIAVPEAAADILTNTYTTVDNEGLVRLATQQKIGDTRSYTFAYTYDYAGRQISEKHGSILKWKVVLDPFGNTIKHIIRPGATDHTTQFEYYTDSALKKVWRPGAFGSISYQRNLLELLSSADDPGLGLPVANITYHHDRFNRARIITDARGKNWLHDYDELDNHISVTTPLGHSTTTTYDLREYRESVHLPDGARILEERDDDGLINTRTSPRNTSWKQNYSAMRAPLHNKPQITDPYGEQGVAERTTSGLPLASYSGGFQTATQPDSAGRSILTQLPGSSQKRKSTWGARTLDQVTDRENTVTTFGHRPADGVATSVVTDPGGKNITTTVLPDNLGLPAEITLQNIVAGADSTLVLEYDELLRAKRINAGGQDTRITRDGHGNVRTVEIPGILDAVMSYDPAGNLVSRTVNQRTTTYDYDDDGNLVTITEPGSRITKMEYDSRGNLTHRRWYIGVFLQKHEKFQRNPDGAIERRDFIESGLSVRGETFRRDPANRLIGLITPEILGRSLTRHKNHLFGKDAVGTQMAETGIGPDGRPDSERASAAFTFDRDNEDRIVAVRDAAGAPKYLLSRDNVGHVENFTDHGYLGGNILVDYTPDSSGHPWRRDIPALGTRLQNELNAAGALSKSTLTIGGVSRTVEIPRTSGVRPDGILRPGAVPNTAMVYNDRHELVAIDSGTAGLIQLGRDPDTGRVASRQLTHLGYTETYTYDALDRLAGETRSDGSLSARYTYDSVGVPRHIEVNGRVGELIRVHPVRPDAPIVGDIYRVGPGTNEFLTIEEAVGAIYAHRGTNEFTIPAVVIVTTEAYTDPVNISTNLGALQPTAANPLDIRGETGSDIVLSGSVDISGIRHIRLVSLNVKGNVLFADTEGASLSSSIIEASVAFSNAPAASIVGNTFNGAGGRNLTLHNCPGSMARNNIMLHAPDGILWSNTAPDSDFNLYHPGGTAALSETNSIVADPLLDLSYMLASNSPAIHAGQTLPGHLAAYRGRLRDGIRSCIGADEYFDTSITNQLASYGMLANAPGGPQHLAPPDGPAWRVGPGQPHANVADALAAIHAERGSAPFASPAVVLLDAGIYTNDIAVTTNSLLAPTAANPLIIRSRPENRVILTGAITVRGVQHTKLQGFHIDATPDKPLRFEAATGCALTASAVKSAVIVTNCVDLKLIGNTFDYRAGTDRIDIVGGTGILLRNNIILNDGATAGIDIADTAPNSDYNCYFPSNSVVFLETHSIYTDPMLHPTAYTVTNLASGVIRTGEHIDGYTTDIGGYDRDPQTPGIGASEVLFDDIGAAPDSRGSDGRLNRRRAGRWTIDRDHDGRGRLTACHATDGLVTNTATYAYDPFTRRTDMTTTLDGTTQTYRFVYDNHDVIAEFVDETGDGLPDRQRVYWLTEGIDQRIGFADITTDGVAFYYYLVDQVGTVHRILDDTGTVVNQYQYDAWGNVQWNSSNTFETVENRYLFQGREWDPVGKHYYYRHRTYLPDQRRFDGADINLAAGILAETEGFASDAFCRNDPINYIDPLGLAVTGSAEEMAAVAAAYGASNIKRVRRYRSDWIGVEQWSRTYADGRVESSGFGYLDANTAIDPTFKMILREAGGSGYYRFSDLLAYWKTLGGASVDRQTIRAGLASYAFQPTKGQAFWQNRRDDVTDAASEVGYMLQDRQLMNFLAPLAVGVEATHLAGQGLLYGRAAVGATKAWAYSRWLQLTGAAGAGGTALQKLAQSGGPTTRVYTSLTSLPQPGRVLYGALESSISLTQKAGFGEAGRQLYMADIPKALLQELLYRDLIYYETTLMGGAQGLAIVFKPAAIEYIRQFFALVGGG